MIVLEWNEMTNEEKIDRLADDLKSLRTLIKQGISDLDIRIGNLNQAVSDAFKKHDDRFAEIEAKIASLG